LKGNRLKKKQSILKFICAFAKNQKVSIRLPFDKMILRFVLYPIMGVIPDGIPKRKIKDKKKQRNVRLSVNLLSLIKMLL
jgi:hypothetical protein